MTGIDWQIVATIACIVLAAGIVLRRVIRLFSASRSGCGSACAGCVKQPTGGSQPNGFVSLDSLVKSSVAVKETTSSGH